MLKFLGSATAVSLMLAAFGVSAASATPITVANFSFETPTESPGGAYSTNSVTSWAGVGSGSPQFGTYNVVTTQYPGVGNWHRRFDGTGRLPGRFY